MVFCRQVLLLAAIQLSSLAAARSFGDRLVIKPREYTNSSSSSSSDSHISSNNYIAASLETGLAPHSRSLVAVPSSDTEDSSSNSPGGPAETSRLISTKQQQVYTSDISSQITVPTATSPTTTSKVTVPTSSVLSSSLSFPTFSPSGNSTTRWPNSTSSTTSSWSSDTAITRAPHTSSVLTYNSASSQSSYTIITVPPFTTSKPSTSVTMSISTASSRNYTSSSYGNNTTTTQECTTLEDDEPVTIYIINPNPNTVTVTIHPNATANATMPAMTTIPEFTPPTYCTPDITATEPFGSYSIVPPQQTPGTNGVYSTSGKEPGSSEINHATTLYSIGNPSPVTSFLGTKETTTVITTSKNPVTVYTTEAPLDYPGVKTNKVEADPTDTDINWGPIGGGGGPTAVGPTSIPISTINNNPPTVTGGNGGSGSGGSGSGSNNQQGSPEPTTTTVGRVPVVIEPTQVIIGSQTIPVPTPAPTQGGNGVSNGNGNGASNGNGNGGGGAPVVVTEAGQVFTINPSQVIGAGTTLNIPSKTAAGAGVFVQQPEITTIAGVPVQIGVNSAVISGTTYSIGAGAPETTVVVNGQTISIGAGGLGFAQTTVAPLPGLPTNVVIVDGKVFSAISGSIAVIDGTTFTYGPGKPTQTDAFNGATITMGPNGISFGGSVLPTRSSGTQLGIAGGLTITEIGSTIAIISGVTFTVGPNATPTTTVIAGHTITAGPIGLGLAATTLSYPFNPTTQVLTIGGITISEIGPSLVNIGGTTYTYGGTAKQTTATYNGQTISIGPGGIGFASTTLTSAATSTPTSATSAKATGKKNSANGVLRPMGGVLGTCIIICIGYLI